MKKLGISLLIVSILSLSACDKFRNNEEAQEVQTTEPTDNVRANFDVDAALTNQLKTQLVEKYPQTSATETVEGFLKTQDYDCGVDPTAQTERACIKTETKDTCILMTIVRTSPYTPEGAQVIKVCDVAPTK